MFSTPDRRAQDHIGRRARQRLVAAHDLGADAPTARAGAAGDTDAGRIAVTRHRLVPTSLSATSAAKSSPRSP